MSELRARSTGKEKAQASKNDQPVKSQAKKVRFSMCGCSH